eukprot:364533-Chlamydomonas_euryale.AAC.13
MVPVPAMPLSAIPKPVGCWSNCGSKDHAKSCKRVACPPHMYDMYTSMFTCHDACMPMMLVEGILRPNRVRFDAEAMLESI